MQKSGIFSQFNSFKNINYSNTNLNPNWLCTITNYVWITSLQFLYINNNNILCSGPLDCLGIKCTRYWSVNTGMGAAMQHGAAASEPPDYLTVFSLAFRRRLPINVPWDSSLVSGPAHCVHFMARIMVLLEDKCFSLTIKWRIWRQHVVPDHFYIFVMLHGAFTQVGLADPSLIYVPPDHQGAHSVLYYVEICTLGYTSHQPSYTQ